MTTTATIKQGDTAGPWLLGHVLDDGTYADLSSVDYSCTIKVAGTAIERAVTDLNADEDRFIAALTPAETATLEVKQHVVAIQIVNTALTPPLTNEQHIILTVEAQIVGSDYVPVDETEVERITREIREVKAQRHKIATGTATVKIARDGRLVEKAILSMRDYTNLLNELECELKIATADVAGTARRRPIGLAWSN